MTVHIQVVPSVPSALTRNRFESSLRTAAPGGYFLIVGSRVSESVSSKLTATGIKYVQKSMDSGEKNWGEIRDLAGSARAAGVIVTLNRPSKSKWRGFAPFPLTAPLSTTSRCVRGATVMGRFATKSGCRRSSGSSPASRAQRGARSSQASLGCRRTIATSSCGAILASRMSGLSTSVGISRTSNCDARRDGGMNSWVRSASRSARRSGSAFK